MTEEIERRLVRTGVRIGYIGGPFELREFGSEAGVDVYPGLAPVVSSSKVVWELPFKSSECVDSWSDRPGDILRRVVSLELR